MAVEQVNTTADALMETSFGCYRLQRYPVRKKQVLRAWDAADEYLLDYLYENDLLHQDISLLIVNDSFGGLSIPLNHYQPVVMTDSFLSMQGISLNLETNNIDHEAVTIINSLEAPGSVLDGHSGNGTAEVVLIRIPKSLAMLEDQLHRVRASVGSSTTIIAGGKTKNIHTSTLELFEKIIGPTTTSLARKKARLIFSRYDADMTVIQSPGLSRYTLAPGLAGSELEFISHAAVFSRERLDAGARLFLENMPAEGRYRTIVDLGCGNGVLGVVAAIKNPAAKLIFADESYMAVESAIDNFSALIGETRDAEFLQTDCLYGVPKNSVSLVLCNPPFHYKDVMNDETAWQMFTESRAVLESGGELWVIGNRHLAYHAKLKHLFGNCEVVASDEKFTLLKSIKNQQE